MTTFLGKFVQNFKGWWNVFFNNERNNVFVFSTLIHIN